VTHLSPPPADRPGRLRVGVIGTGRVGAVLGAALGRAGHRVVAVAAVSDRSRERAELLLPGVPVLPAPDVATDCDLLLLTVPDDQLAGLAAGLAETGALRASQLVVHTSGRFGLEVLSPVKAVGAVPLALHPVMTFTGTSLDLDRLSGCVFGVTAPATMTAVADALVIELGGEPVHVLEERRGLYHAALAHGANHLVTLVASAAELLREAGVAEPDRVLQPLLSAALDNTLRDGDAALTGPVARGDAGTVARHLTEIAQVSPATARAYVDLARLTADRAVAAGVLDQPGADRVRAVLDASGGAQ
jgi:predicted short-subunit dehydrogenase-like oxidoreductase (DUF2520 family)